MPTILTHAVIPLSIGIGLGRSRVSPHLLCAGVVAAMLPDLDVLAFHFNIAYGSDLGHRGVSHSLAFALLVACLAAWGAQRLHTTLVQAVLFVGLSCASHGLLDMVTNGGQGVALWWPGSGERLFFPWRPVEVSPIGLQRFFSARGWHVLQSEMLWIWIPAVALCGGLRWWHNRAPLTAFPP